MKRLEARPGFVWLEYPETGGKAEFPVDAALMWEPRGWQPCEPPLEPDLTKDHTQSTDEVPAEPEPSPAEPEPVEVFDTDALATDDHTTTGETNG